MSSSHLILCHPLLLLPPMPPSIRVFPNESTLCMKWPKYWTFSFSISPSNEHPGLISFRMDWMDLLAVQGTLKSLPQHHSSKSSIFQCSAFFTVQLSHPYTTTGKTGMIRSLKLSVIFDVVGFKSTSLLFIFSLLTLFLCSSAPHFLPSSGLFEYFLKNLFQLSVCFTCTSVPHPGGSDGKEPACNAGDLHLIPRSGRSPGEGNGNPRQYSWLENLMDRGAWRAAVHGVSESQTQLSN